MPCHKPAWPFVDCCEGNLNFHTLQLSEKIAEGGDKASVSAVDLVKRVADQAEPTAERINRKIEKEAHNLTANADFHANDVADEYQKGMKVIPCRPAWHLAIRIHITI